MSLKNEVIDFCKSVGADPLLVQGAGGNVSWKDGDILWVKGSGTWLADAGEQEIFVPVNLPYLREALSEGDFNVTPLVAGVAGIKPSIETVLHALMPQPVVVHLHAIEILACLVREDTADLLARVFGNNENWRLVPYRKPGADLAEAVHAALSSGSNIQIVFLQNHGVVLGAESTSEIEEILCNLIAACKSELDESGPPASLTDTPLSLGEQSAYLPLPDLQMQQLALDPMLYRYLSSKWVLYPDHAVFLGASATCYENIDDFLQQVDEQVENNPRVVFVRSVGVFVTSDFGSAHFAQLRCYYEVLRRQQDHAPLKSLSAEEVSVLLNWDAEKYRMNMMNNQEGKRN